MTLGSFPQTATYWEVTGNDGFGGKTFSTPVSLNVRWQDVNEKFVNANAEEVVSMSKVFLEDDVTIGSFLYLGTSVQSSPYDQSSAFEIKSFSKIVTMDGIEYERKAML